MIQANYYPPNGYPYQTCADFRGESTDTKPSDVSEGSTFHEWDTGNEYMFDGSDWLLQSGGGGGGKTYGSMQLVGVGEVSSGAVGEPAAFYVSTIDNVLNPAVLEINGLYAADAVTAIAANAEVYLQFDTSVGFPPATTTLTVYDADSEMSLTATTVEVTPDEYEGKIFGATFTVPEVDVENGHIVLLGIESSN